MADGRRSESHDADLLRKVFVILSGGLAFFVAVLLVWKLRRIVALIVIAAFFATILNPLVDALTRLRMRRGVATSIVFFLGVMTFAGLVYTFVRPDLRRRAGLRPGHPRASSNGPRTAKAGSAS